LLVLLCEDAIKGTGKIKSRNGSLKIL
jgi:hypothetical protein